jgi:transcriptional regulator GlxA family with amidase domain
MVRVGVVAMNGALASAALGCIDVLRIANRVEWSHGRAAPRFEAELVSVDGLDATASGGITLPVAGSLQSGAFDVVIVPGIEAGSGREMARALEAAPELAATLAALHGRGAIVAGACTGVWFLAEAGLLDGRAATTSWWLMRSFAARYPSVRIDRERIVCADGHVYTAGATTAYFNLMLAIVERFAGSALHRETAKYLLIDANRLPQGAFIPLHVSNVSDDRVVDAAERYIQQHLTGPLDVDAVAAHCHVTLRTLQRHFQRALGQSPLSYIRRMRLERAKGLLETTALPLQDIVNAVGYEDPSSFTALFRRETGTTPSAYRRHVAASNR